MIEKQFAPDTDGFKIHTPELWSKHMMDRLMLPPIFVCPPTAPLTRWQKVKGWIRFRRYRLADMLRWLARRIEP